MSDSKGSGNETAWVIGLLAMVAIGVYWMGRDTKADQALTIYTDREPVAALPAPPAIAKPSHFYSMRDGQQYGYEVALSAEDAAAGQMAKELLMATYLGEYEGETQLLIRQGPTLSSLQCKPPCEFFKIGTYYNGAFRDHSYLKAGPGMALTLMMTDAQNGELERFVSTTNGKPEHVKINERGRQERVPVTASRE